MNDLVRRLTTVLRDRDVLAPGAALLTAWPARRIPASVPLPAVEPRRMPPATIGVTTDDVHIYCGGELHTLPLTDLRSVRCVETSRLEVSALVNGERFEFAFLIDMPAAIAGQLNDLRTAARTSPRRTNIRPPRKRRGAA